MATVDEKTARLNSAHNKMEAFLAAGGKLGSPQSIPVGLEFVNAFADLAKEFGYNLLKEDEGKATAHSQPRYNTPQKKV
jgi:hypothetical protein